MSKLKIKHLGDILGITFPDDIEITHATNSTKKVKKNSIFFGLQGTKVHGSKYIEEAIELGASVAVHDDPNFKINNQDLKNKVDYLRPIKLKSSNSLIIILSLITGVITAIFLVFFNIFIIEFRNRRV